MTTEQKIEILKLVRQLNVHSLEDLIKNYEEIVQLIQ